MFSLNSFPFTACIVSTGIEGGRKESALLAPVTLQAAPDINVTRSGAGLRLREKSFE